MTDTHVVSALKDKRIAVASQIESLQGQLRQAVIELDHVEAALLLFDPRADLAALPARKAPPSPATPRAIVTTEELGALIHKTGKISGLSVAIAPLTQ